MRTAYGMSIAIAILVSGAAVAVAENYVDNERRFEVTIPDGWQHFPGKDGPLGLGLLSPRIKTTGALCLLLAVDAADTRKMTQEEIDKETSATIDEAFWRGVLAQMKARDVTVESSTKMKEGRRVHRATARMVLTVKEADKPLQADYAVQFSPGQMLMGQCLVDQAHVATESADIETILDSFNTLGPGVIARVEPPRTSMPGQAALVLYTGPRFDGAQRDLTQDMPNLFQAGWSTMTASFSVNGYGLWEICDGINYQGNCRAVAGAESAVLGDRALRIGSARRIINAQGPRAAVGAASEHFAAGMKDLLQRRNRPN